MNNSTTEIEQIKIHIENRNKILRELRQIYVNNSSCHTSDLDGYTCNVPETGEYYSPIVEDLLMEMNRKKLKKFYANNNPDCYRCKHFLNIPQNLIEACEKISDCTEEFETDLNFVQAVVWLKSATMFMKDVSIEQFHLVFHNQWNNNGNKKKDSDCCNRDAVSEVQERDCIRSNSTNPPDVNQRGDIISDSDREISQYNCQSDTKQNEDFPRKRSDLSIFASQSPERYFQSFMENSGNLNNAVISDSDRRYSSSSDIFKDSSESHEIRNAAWNKNDNKLLEENDFINDLASQSSDLSQKTCLGSEDDVSGSLHEDDSSDMFNEECLLYGQSVNHLQNDGIKWASLSSSQLLTQYIKISDSNFHHKNPTVSANQTGNVCSPQKDSAYDTYPLSGEHYAVQNEDVNIFSSPKIDNIISYQRNNSTNDDSKFLTLDIAEEDCVSRKDYQSCISSLNLFTQYTNENNTESTKKESREQNANRDPEANESLTKNIVLMGTCVKKRKLECENGIDCMVKKNTKEEERKISSECVRFTLDALSTDDVALQSVRVILSVFQNERIARQYMKKRYWRNTLEAEAVNTILNFRDIFEAENKANACTHEIVQTITNTLEESIENTELNKVTVLTHQISIILELCSSMKVCIETINYLTAKLKSQESILISLMNDKKANVYHIVNQLHFTFYALSICLKKYRLVFSNTDNHQFEDETIPPVVDLWKKQLKFENIIVEESLQTRERRWLMILDDFAVSAAENCTQFAEQSRRLTNILTCKQTM